MACLGNLLIGIKEMAKENLIFLLKADLLRLAGTKKNTTKIFFFTEGPF